MKLNNLTKGVIAFSVLSMIASGALIASAASDTALSANATGRNHGRGFNKESMVKLEDMTDTQKAALETRKAEMDLKQAAVKAAIVAGDYNAWVAAEKAMNEDCPLLSKITAANFSKYIEAYNLRAQADVIMKDLGIEGQGMNLGFGAGKGMGMGRGQK